MVIMYYTWESSYRNFKCHITKNYIFRWEGRHFSINWFCLILSFKLWCYLLLIYDRHLLRKLYCMQVAVTKLSQINIFLFLNDKDSNHWHLFWNYVHCRLLQSCLTMTLVTMTLVTYLQIQRLWFLKSGVF